MENVCQAYDYVFIFGHSPCSTSHVIKCNGHVTMQMCKGDVQPYLSRDNFKWLRENVNFKWPLGHFDRSRDNY